MSRRNVRFRFRILRRRGDRVEFDGLFARRERAFVDGADRGRDCESEPRPLLWRADPAFWLEQATMSGATAMERLPLGVTGTLKSFFQPVISVADGSVYGYEVLGRQESAEKVESLGPFFANPNIREGDKITVDRRIREQALQSFRSAGLDARVFVNIHPNWIYRFHDRNEEFPTLRLAREAGLKPEQLVIEITEQEFHEEDFGFLNRLVDRYREAGARIAIDDFSYANFDRLISLKPDFVKVDIRLVKMSGESAEYRKLIRYISTFSQELGIAVIFEGVETENELENSIEAGGSFIQGFYFSEARESFQANDAFRDSIQRALHNVSYRQLHNSRNVLKIEESMNRYLALVIEREQLFERANLDDALNRILSFLPPQCFRAFICDGLGVQRSSNFTKSRTGKFQIFPEHRGKNWGWRPYFFYNLVRMNEFQRGVISQKYVDVETKQDTLTFSYPIGQDMYVFLDFISEF